MSKKLVVGVSGNLTRPSKTKAFIDHIAAQVASSIGAASTIFDIEDLGPSFSAGKASWRSGSVGPQHRRAIAGRRRPGGWLADFQRQLHRAFQAFLRPARPVIAAGKAGHPCCDRRRRSSFADGRASASAAVRLLRGADPADRDLCLRQGLRQRRAGVRSHPCSRPASGRRGMPGGCHAASVLPPERTASPTGHRAPRFASCTAFQRRLAMTRPASRDRSSSAPSCPAADSTSPPGAIPTRRPTARPISSSTGGSR